MVNRLVSVGDDFVLPAEVRALLRSRQVTEINAEEDFGVLTTNSAAVNTINLQAAIDAAKAAKLPLFIPGGTYQVNELTLPSLFTMRGAGRPITTLRYNGTGTAISSATPGVRAYDWTISDLTLSTPSGGAGGAIGFDMDSVSTSIFSNLSVGGWSNCAFYVHSATAGGALYNRFINVSALSNTVGWKNHGIESNNNHWAWCRAGNGTNGIEIIDSNDCTVRDTALEGLTNGVYITATTTSRGNHNRIRDCRPEGCTIGVNIDSGNVRYTEISGIWYDSATPTPVRDTGYHTRYVTDNMYLNQAQTSATFENDISLTVGSLYLGSSGASINSDSSSHAPLNFHGQVADSGSNVSNWFSNSPELTSPGTRIAGFSRNNAHTAIASYIDLDGSYEFAGSGVKVMSGTGSPVGVVTAVVGSLFLRSDGNAGTTLYVKESGAGNTGWVTYQATTMQPTVLIPYIPGTAPGVGVLAANRAYFLRFQVLTPSTYRYLNWVCSVASGNFQVGVVALSGTGRTTWTPVVTSGILAAPVAGDIRQDLGLFTLQPGDYALSFWTDNATLQTLRTAGATAALKISGRTDSLATGVTGTGTWVSSASAVAMGLEADV
jgi:hypothetical protein